MAFVGFAVAFFFDVCDTFVHLATVGECTGGRAKGGAICAVCA